MQRRRSVLSLPLCLAAAAAAAALALEPGGGAAVTPATATLAPLADSYVTSLRPAANFGKAKRLVVARRPAAIGFLRFRVAVPAGSTVARATLRLYAASAPTGGLAVHRVASTSWGERTITYRNAPAIGAKVVALSGSHRAGTYVSLDVTPLVTGSGLVSLALTGGSASPSSFRSRESGSGRPRLVVETSTAGGSGDQGGGGGPCGAATAPPGGIDHVIWIWMENKPYDAIIGSPSAPYENQLASACGLATSYRGVAHPSLPNYIAATSGGTQGISDDDPPSAHPLDVPSIYSQLKTAGKTWRDYAESAPGTCPSASSGTYGVKHDPAAYYTGIRADCAGWDVPMGTTSGGNFLSDLTSGNLPAFSFVIPDLCNDTHDCPVAVGDAWLQSWFEKILASPAYLAGRTVVFVVWDEDDGSPENHIPLIVVSPSTPAGARSATFFDHYALLRTTEQLLGLPFLGHAADAASMVSAFNLG